MAATLHFLTSSLRAASPISKGSKQQRLRPCGGTLALIFQTEALACSRTFDPASWSSATGHASKPAASQQPAPPAPQALGNRVTMCSLRSNNSTEEPFQQ